MNAKKELQNILNGTARIKCADISESEWKKSIKFQLRLNYTESELQQFLKSLDFEYDNGYGGQNLFGLVWLDDGTWLSRGEYDGSEWWIHHTMPKIPNYLSGTTSIINNPPSKPITVELKDLVGLHELSGVDFSHENIKSYGDQFEDANIVRFVLDGKTYKAIEDPSDGYRSMLGELLVCDEKVNNTFPPQKIVGKMDGDSRINDIIEFIDIITGKAVLEIGTAHYDDYYPSCVMSWSPENLAINTIK